MAEPIPDHLLLELCGAGNQLAAQQIFDAYAERLMALARRRISRRLASRVDPEDVVQSVFRTFFARLKDGRFRLAEQDDLCKVLVRITVHKALRQVVFHRRAKRDLRQEAGSGALGLERLQEVRDAEPTPEAATAFVDLLEHLFSRLHPQDRQILEMRLQGYTNEEISAELGVYPRKVRRVMERVRGLAELEGLTPSGGDPHGP